MDLFGKKHKAGGRAAKPGMAAASRRNASRKKQDADKVERFRERNLPRKRKPAGSPPSSPSKDFTSTQKKVLKRWKQSSTSPTSIVKQIQARKAEISPSLRPSIDMLSTTAPPSPTMLHTFASAMGLVPEDDTNELMQDQPDLDRVADLA